MYALTLTSAPTRTYRRLCWLTAGIILLSLLLTAVPSLVHQFPALPLTRPATAPTTPTTQELPPGLAPVLNATLAADDAADYAAAPLAAPDAGLRAANPAQRFTTTFGADGVQVALTSGAVVTLHATDLITDGGHIPLAAIQPTIATARVEYRRDGLTEWYINGPRGLEQGFTLAAAPNGAPSFTLALAVTGAVPTQAEDGVLVIGDLRYGGLTVIDAAGETFPAHLDVTDGTIRIAVDARGAVWPVTIDPTITEITLTASDGVVPNQFGGAVASATSLGTTTVAISAPSRNGSIGAVYVFTGSGTTYTQRAILTASDGVGNDHFGYSLAMVSSGGIATIVAGTYKHDQFGNSTGNYFGTVYVFAGQGTSYPQKAILRASGEVPGDDFSYSVGIATDGTNATIVVGSTSFQHVYTFVGSGTSYSQVAQFNDTAPGYSGNVFGYSVAIATSGGTNTIVVGAPFENITGYNYPGVVHIFTGIGTSYTETILQANAPGDRAFFGASVAVAVAHGVNTIIVGETGRTVNGNGGQGAAYVYTGNGTTYTFTEFTDSQGNSNEQFGASVAVGFAGGSTLVAISAPGRTSTTALFLYTGTNGAYTGTTLPQTASGSAYVQRVALTTAVNGDVAVVGGEPLALGWAGQVGLYYFKLAPAVNSVQAWLGDGAQVVTSPTGTFSGTPFYLTARAFDAHGISAIPVDVTFTLNYAGAAKGVFDRNQPNLTTLHVTTLSDGNSSMDGNTPEVPIYPSSTAGTFTVTASVDGLGPTTSALFTLTIIAGIPVPAISRLAGTETRAGLAGSTYIVISGSGFMNYGLTQVWMSFGLVHDNTDAQVPNGSVSYVNSGTLGAFLPANQLNAHVGVIYIFVKSLPGPSGSDGGVSNEKAFIVRPAAPAPSGSSAAPLGNTTIHLAPGVPVLAGAPVKDTNQQPLIQPATGTGSLLVAAGGGNLISQDGSTLVSPDAGTVISNDGGSVISDHGSGLISDNGLGLTGASAGGAAPSSARSAAPGSAPSGNPATTPRRSTISNLPARNPYYGGSDAHGVFLSPPIFSNGIVGTYTRTIAIDGIAAPVTYTIINLDPNDGHPAAITHLSSAGAAAGDPGFTLTVTGTGFVAGSVLSYGGVQLVTTFDSATQVHATITPTLLKYTGALNVIVINPDPNGGASLPATFTVTPKMALTTLSPNLAQPGSVPFTLTAKGTDFITGSTVVFNGTNLPTTFVSATQLNATVPANLVTAAGTAQVTVVDPLGGTSGAVTFTIAVVNALPPSQPGGPPASGPSALPGSRQPSGPASGSPAPVPLPPSR